MFLADRASRTCLTRLAREFQQTCLRSRDITATISQFWALDSRFTSQASTIAVAGGFGSERTGEICGLPHFEQVTRRGVRGTVARRFGQRLILVVRFRTHSRRNTKTCSIQICEKQTSPLDLELSLLMLSACLPETDNPCQEEDHQHRRDCPVFVTKTGRSG